MSDNGVVWEDPPEVLRKSGSWKERLAPLVDRPGAWARVYEGTTTTVTSAKSQLQRGVLRAPPGRWEFATRAGTNNLRILYARYLGPDEDGGS